VQQVLAAGYRRVGFVMNSIWDFGVDLAWSAGFLAEQQQFPPENRLPILFFPDPWPRKRHHRPEDADEVLRELFATWYREHRPDVLISHGPFVRSQLAALHLSVPRDVAFADILLEDEGGKVAGVRQNCRRVGELAVELLASQLQQDNLGIPRFPTCTLVEGTWCQGRSLPIRAPRRDSRSVAGAMLSD